MPDALKIVQKFYQNVTAVKDATKSLEIQVESKDVKSSSVRNHKECALAHACKRLQDVDGVIMSVSTAYIIKGDIAYRYQVPETASREIVSFDRDAGFMPGTYQLVKPYPTNRIGAERRSTKPKKRTRASLVRRHVTEGIRANLQAP
jgi:hypothetical protein